MTLGGLWGPPPFLAAVLRSEFPGVTDLTTGALHPWPGSRRGAAVLLMTSGAKAGGPQRFQTGSQTPEPTRASGRRRGTRASGQTPAGRRRSPRAASPASPRKPRRRPPSPRSRSPGPGTHSAMAQPETGPSTSSGRIRARAGLWAGWESRGFRLAASGLEVSREWGSEPVVPGEMQGRRVAVGAAVLPRGSAEVATRRRPRMWRG